MSIASMTLQDLQNAKYQVASPFQLMISGQVIHCEQLLRIVPGKRMVFLGTYLNKKAIIKLFLHPSRAKIHWSREISGADLLSKHHILTPELTESGLSDEGPYILIFRYIEGQNLAQFWLQNSQQEQQQQLKKMISVLVRHHYSGLAHQDLHYGNFFLEAASNDVESDIYTLDGEELKQSTAPLKKKERFNNLALFIAQTFDTTEKYSTILLAEYASLANMSLSKTDRTQFWHLIQNFQQGRIEHYLKKILRECTDVIYEKKRQSYTLCRREYHNQAVQQLLNQPELFFQNEQSVFLKQGNTCTVKSVLVGGEKYVIKRYNPKGMVYELMHKGQNSRARKSWINAHLLRFMGILTPEPVALIELTPSLGKRCSYFICKYQQGQSSWDFFCDERKLGNDKSTSNKQIVADTLIATLNQLSDYNITHGDLKGSNFLIDGTNVWMLDLDAMVQHKTKWRFKQSWQRDKIRFLKNWDKKDCYKDWKYYFNQALSSAL